MKSYLLSIFMGFVGIIVSAQTFEINGTVKDPTDMPLPGVSVIVKNSTRGASTDFDGNFTVAGVQNGEVLEFSYIGFATKEITIVNANPLNVILEEDAEALEEVVVIGYGTQKVSKISGAVSTVNKKSIENLKPVRLEEALQGQTPGVNIISSGSPGSKPTVMVRGIPSFNGGDPLVVIDGVSQSLDDLNSLNPSNIESLSVLKDAAMSAIYGVKGGNGVIVVKTKSGSRDTKTTFAFDSSYGIQEVKKTIDVLNASEYAAILNEASANATGSIVFDDISGLGTGTDWQDEVLKEAPISTYNLSASGGSEKASYFISAAYLAQEGVVGGGDKSFFDRANFSANYNTDLSDDFTFIVNTNYTNIKSKSLSENNIGSVLSNALNFDPTVSPFDADGNYGVSNTITQEIKNPLALINDTYNNKNTNKLTGKLELQYDVVDNLKVTSRFGYTFVDEYSKNFFPLVYYGIGHNNTTAHEDLSHLTSTDEDGVETVLYHNRVSESKTNYFNYTYELYGNYDFNLNEDNTFQTVLGISLGRDKGENITANAEDVPFNSWNYADVGAATGDLASQSSGSWQYVNRNLSYFGRINYDYKGKYLLSFTGRSDGSTKFGKNNKFAFFPSASLGWVVSNEDFFKTELLNYLKLRGSYGSVGSDNIDPQFTRISTFPSYTFDGNLISGATLQTIPNDDVSWENQIQYNAGLDIRVLDNKVSLSADYFEKIVDGLLFDPTLSLYLGTPEYPSTNIGKTKTSGIDASLRYRDTYADDINFNTSFSFTMIKSNVEEINNGDKFVWGSGYGIPWTNITRFEEGFSPFYFYGYKTDGIFQNQDEIDAHATQNGAVPGDIRFADLNDDGIINDQDRTEIGNPSPDLTVGWNLSLDYKNIDFNVFTYASIGNDIYRAYERFSTYTNINAVALDRWTGEGTSNTEPRVTFVDTNNNRRASDRYIEDGSFVKIKNIQLGYTLPESFNDVTGISKFRMYFQVKDAFTFTEYSGFDPEISSGINDTGIDRGSYPIPRVWSFGVNVKF